MPFGSVVLSRRMANAAGSLSEIQQLPGIELPDDRMPFQPGPRLTWEAPRKWLSKIDQRRHTDQRNTPKVLLQPASFFPASGCRAIINDRCPFRRITVYAECRRYGRVGLNGGS